MMNGSGQHPRSRLGGWLAGLGVLALGLVGYQLYRLDSTLRANNDKLAALERVMQLYRFEQHSTTGLGAKALLEQLRFWAPKLESAATPGPERVEIDKRVAEVLKAFPAAGEDATTVLLDEFHKTRSGEQDELRKWIVRALVQTDPERAKSLLVEILRGLKFETSARLRELAADELTALDKVAAGKLLRDILSYESKSGMVLERIPAAVLAERPDLVYGARNPYPGFFNFVGKYVATGDPETIPTLIMLLGRAEHDRMTLQECVKHLGLLKARDAVPKIQELFKSPPEIPDNPIFKGHCLDALASILGAEACEWFREQQTRERQEVTATRLRDLIQKHCR